MKYGIALLPKEALAFRKKYITFKNKIFYSPKIEHSPRGDRTDSYISPDGFLITYNWTAGIRNNKWTWKPLPKEEMANYKRDQAAALSACIVVKAKQLQKAAGYAEVRMHGHEKKAAAEQAHATRLRKQAAALLSFNNSN